MLQQWTRRVEVSRLLFSELPVIWTPTHPSVCNQALPIILRLPRDTLIPTLLTSVDEEAARVALATGISSGPSRTAYWEVTATVGQINGIERTDARPVSSGTEAKVHQHCIIASTHSRTIVF